MNNTVRPSWYIGRHDASFTPRCLAWTPHSFLLCPNMILVMSWCVVTSRPPALLATSQMVTILGLCGCSASDRKAPFSLSFAPIGTSSSPGSAGGYAPCTDAGVKMPGTGKYLGVVGGNVLLRRQSTSWSSGHQPWQEPGGYGSMSSSDNDGAVVPRHPGTGEAWHAGVPVATR